jgi:hypothetical protein
MGDAEPVPAERVKALLGRVPSKADRERLAKVRDALGIRSTDAVWDIMIALDYHLLLYAAVPDKIAEQTRLAAAELGRIVEGAKRKERSGRGEVVASIGAPPTSPGAAAALGAVLVAFGGICIAAGYLMAERGRPPWGRMGPLGAALGAPAGWLVFVLLLPVASRWVRAAWKAARSHEGWRIRAVGWVMLVGAVALIVAGLDVLGWALRR